MNRIQQAWWCEEGPSDSGRRDDGPTVLYVLVLAAHGQCGVVWESQGRPSLSLRYSATCKWDSHGRDALATWGSPLVKLRTTASTTIQSGEVPF